jgi:hypothetical protein
MEQQARARMLGHSASHCSFSRPCRDWVIVFTATRQFLPGHFQSRLAALLSTSVEEERRHRYCRTHEDADP